MGWWDEVRVALQEFLDQHGVFAGFVMILIEEAGVSVPATTVTRLEANEGQRIFPTRRKLSDEQEREVTRLYRDTTMPVSEIARKFGIGESSV